MIPAKISYAQFSVQDRHHFVKNLPTLNQAQRLTLFQAMWNENNEHIKQLHQDLTRPNNGFPIIRNYTRIVEDLTRYTSNKLEDMVYAELSIEDRHQFVKRLPALNRIERMDLFAKMYSGNPQNIEQLLHDLSERDNTFPRIQKYTFIVGNLTETIAKFQPKANVANEENNNNNDAESNDNNAAVNQKHPALDEIIETLSDPVDFDPLTEPKIAKEGQTFSQATISAIPLIKNNIHKLNPITRTPLIDLYPNHLAHDLVDHYTGNVDVTILPDILKCPLTQEKFEEPVVAENGITYEKKAIQKYLAEHKHCLPNSTQPAKNRDLYPNLVVSKVLEIVNTILDNVHDEAKVVAAEPVKEDVVNNDNSNESEMKVPGNKPASVVQSSTMFHHASTPDSSAHHITALWLIVRNNHAVELQKAAAALIKVINNRSAENINDLLLNSEVMNDINTHKTNSALKAAFDFIIDNMSASLQLK